MDYHLHIGSAPTSPVEVSTIRRRVRFSLWPLSFWIESETRQGNASVQITITHLFSL